MNNRFILGLGVLLLFLVGVWLGLDWWRGYAAQDYAVQTEVDLPGASTAVRRIEIRDGEAQLGMQMRDGIWFVETDKPLGDDWAKADDALTLVKLLDGFGAELVSANPERHVELGIDDERAMRILYFENETDTEPKAVLLVSSINQQLVRRPDTDEVYRWSRELSQVVNTNPEVWIQPTPTPAEASTSAEVE